MKIAIDDLQGNALHWAVAKAWGFPADTLTEAAYSTSTASVAEILSKFRIAVAEELPTSASPWGASCMQEGVVYAAFGETSDEAGLRCFVLCELGQIVDVPDEVLEYQSKKSVSQLSGHDLDVAVANIRKGP